MKSVIKGTGYVLVHTPDMVIENGATQTTERVVNPEGEYLKELPKHIRTWEQVLEYWPNQVYIGNKTPDQMKEVPFPWFDKTCDVNDRYGKFGQMMPQEEFYLLMQVSDVFDLVDLEAGFVAANRDAFAANKVVSDDLMARLKDGVEIDAIQNAIDNEAAEPLMMSGKVVGCVKRAHEIDVNLSAHTMLENIVNIPGIDGIAAFTLSRSRIAVASLFFVVCRLSNFCLPLTHVRRYQVIIPWAFFRCWIE